jgi:PKD repeat protein
MHSTSTLFKCLLVCSLALPFSGIGSLHGQCSGPVPTAPITSSTTVSCGQTAQLTASGSTGSYRWFNVSSGGTALFTGTIFTTPALFGSSQIFYVEAFNPSEPTCASARTAVVVNLTSNVLPPVVSNASAACGATTTLTASGSTGNYQWYSDASGGVPLFFGANYDVNPQQTDTFYVWATSDIPEVTQVFNFTGGIQNWTVPAGITEIEVDVRGAKGGDATSGTSPSLGGLGGRVTAVIQVTPGELLRMYVGQQGPDGNNSGFTNSAFNGGGQGYRFGGSGGGSSDIRRGGTAVSNRIIVAGGGGGGGGGSNCTQFGNQADRGGSGGGLTGENGFRCNDPNNFCFVGRGGTSSSGGANNTCYGGSAASQTQGANAPAICCNASGGGGGGFWGGGSGGFGGGAGGSSFAIPQATNVTHTQGFQSGNGQIVVRYKNPICVSPLVPVVVTVSPNSPPTVANTSFACGDAAVLVASGSAGGGYSWYTDAGLTQEIGFGSSLQLPATNVDSTAVYVTSNSNQTVTQTFNFTGQPQTWTVPAFVTNIQVDVQGAQGGELNASNRGGRGGRVQTMLQVTPGEVLHFYVGGTTTSNNPGWNGGGLSGTSFSNARGGGGASDIRSGGTSLNNRVVVAGGGGGNGWNCSTDNHGGNGGGPANAQNGWECNNNNSSNAGSGASPTNGGNNATSCSITLPFSGSFGLGGNGNCSNQTNGGGGGGGWYGGGGGRFGGGGGGSSYADPSRTSSTQHDQGFKTGNGQITITYTLELCQSQATPVVVTYAPVIITNTVNDTVSCAGNAFLSASSTGGVINWFTSPTSQTPFAQSPNLAIPAGNQSVTYFVEAINQNFNVDSTEFSFTGAPQMWVVPSGVTSISVDMYGAQGGANSHSEGGQGGRVQANLTVTPGETLFVYVGGTTFDNNGGWNGGALSGTSFAIDFARGGGGASDIRTGTALNDRIIVAGGGGGAGRACLANQERGGPGGGLVGGNGWRCNSNTTTEMGFGATQTAGGSPASNCSQSAPFIGVFGIGGQGNCSNQTSGGGGGGGWFGGGGGRSGGGGGGSSYTDPTRASNVSHDQGVRLGNGLVKIVWNTPVVCTSARVPVELVIDSLPTPTVSPDAIGCAPVVNTFSASGGIAPYTWYSSVTGNTGVVATGSTYTATASDTVSFFVGYEGPGGCPSKRAKASINPTPLPSAGLDSSSLIFCDNQGIVTLQPNVPGGTFSGTGITSPTLGTFDLSLLAPGFTPVTYSLIQNGCSNSATTDIELRAAPDATVVSASQALCVNASPVVLQTVSSAGVWSGPGMSIDGTFDPLVAGPGTYSALYQIVASNGCVDADSVAIVVNALPDPTITNAPSILCNTSLPVTLLPATSGGTWTGLGVSASTGVFNPSQSGVGVATINYVVQQNGCSDSSQVQITVQAGPDPTITSSPGTLCENGSSFQLTSITSGGSWSGSGIVSATSGLFNPANAGVGSQMVYYSVQQGICSAMDSLQLNVAPAPVVALTPAQSQALCEGSSVTFSATGGQTYQWFLNGNPIAGATSASLPVNASGNYSVSAISIANCSATSAQIGVTVNAKPVITGIQVPAVCQGQSSAFNSQANVAQNGGAVIASYAWDFGGFGSGNSSQPTFNFPQAGTYPVTLIVGTNQGCFDTLSTLANVNPVPLISNVSVSDVCEGTPVNFSAAVSLSPVNNAQLLQPLWSFGNGFTGSGTSVNHLYVQPGSFSYSIQATTNQGCSAIAQGTVNVFAKPVALFNAVSDCQGSGIPFINLSSSNVNSWNWNFGDGNSSTLQNPVHTYTSAGQFPATLTVTTSNGCTDTYGQSVVVTPGPDAAFSAFAQGGLAYQFSPNILVAGATYAWSFGDGTASTAPAPFKAYNSPGNYTVCLSVSRGNCTTVSCENVNVQSSTGIEGLVDGQIGVFPNPFSQQFTLNIELLESEQVALRIFDVTGKLLYTQNEGLLTAGGNAIQVDLAGHDLATGIYILEVQVGSHTHPVRVVKN